MRLGSGKPHMDKRLLNLSTDLKLHSSPSKKTYAVEPVHFHTCILPQEHIPMLKWDWKQEMGMA